MTLTVDRRADSINVMSDIVIEAGSDYQAGHAAGRNTALWTGLPGQLHVMASLTGHHPVAWYDGFTAGHNAVLAEIRAASPDGLALGYSDGTPGLLGHREPYVRTFGPMPDTYVPAAA